MAYVICEPCIGAKELACVDVCPVDCIQGGPDEEQMYIDPVTCIDCDACEPVCPVSAIFVEAAVPEKWHSYIKKNADFFKRRSGFQRNTEQGRVYPWPATPGSRKSSKSAYWV